jgi:mannitol/fructose-specific phosphotransferase system IIA component (Ntr-type)
VRKQEVQTSQDLLLRLEREGRCLPLTVHSDEADHPIHDRMSFREGDEITYLCYDPAGAVTPVAYDRFDRLVENATVIDLEEEMTLDAFFGAVADRLADTVGVPGEELQRLMREKERDFSSLIAPGFAVPHVAVDRPDVFHIAIVRSRDGIAFPAVQERAHALFVIVRSATERTLHLRVLAAIAQIIQDPSFETRWETAQDGEALRRMLREADRRRFE